MGAMMNEEQQQQRDDNLGLESRESLSSLDSLYSDNAAMQQELFFDGDLDEIFDDDDTANHLTSENNAMMGELDGLVKEKEKNGALPANDDTNKQSSTPPHCPPDKPASSTSMRKTTSDSLGKNKRRRSSIIPEKNGGCPPPTWHSEAADKKHRLSMILEMYVVQ
jgi:hypothetical protein